jgi:hypothetical protein
MNGYKAFYRGKTLEVYAASSYEAQVKAAALFKAKKAHEVSIVLCKLQGEQVTHTPSY